MDRLFAPGAKARSTLQTTSRVVEHVVLAIGPLPRHAFANIKRTLGVSVRVLLFQSDQEKHGTPCSFDFESDLDGVGEIIKCVWREMDCARDCVHDVAELVARLDMDR